MVPLRWAAAHERVGAALPSTPDPDAAAYARPHRPRSSPLAVGPDRPLSWGGRHGTARCPRGPTPETPLQPSPEQQAILAARRRKGRGELSA